MNSKIVRPAAGSRFATLALLLAPFLLPGCMSTAVPGQSRALWILVNARCNQGWAPLPLIQCFPERGEALLRDQCGGTRFLLVALARRTGVESPELLRDDEPDYFADAWIERERVIAASDRRAAGSDELGLAINSRWGRSEDQLHIHIDFVRPDVRAAIKQWEREGDARAPIEIFGHAYRIVHQAGFGRPTPFQQAAATGDALAQRERQTIAAVGDGASGIYLLFGQADPGGPDRGHGEEILMPRSCSR